MTEHFEEAPAGLRDDVIAGLRRFGFAPGGYMGTCGGCGSTMTNVDKRCRRCWQCAVLAATDQQETPAPPVPSEAGPLASVFIGIYQHVAKDNPHDYALKRASEAVQAFWSSL